MATAGKVAIPYYTVCFLVLLVFGILRVVLQICFLRRFAIKFFKWSSGMDKVPEENYKDSLFGWQMYKAMTEAILLDMKKSVRSTKPAPNPSVFSLDDRRKCGLLDFARDSRPLVVNFGSCTCPIFMAELEDFGKTIKEFGDIADFLVIYVDEAHPTDGWAFKNNYDVRQHRSLEERFKAAELLVSIIKHNMAVSVAVDTVDKEATLAFGALPIRQYVILEGRVLYRGGMGPVFYRTREISDWLHSWRNTETCV